MKKVLVVGGVSFDSIIYTDNFPEPKPQTVFSKHFHETIGSPGPGKALNLNRLGFNTTLHGFIGNDIYGEKIATILKEQNINFVSEIDTESTKRHINLMDDNGDRISIFVTYGTFEPEFNIQKIKKQIKQNDIIILNIINYVRKVIPIAKEYNKEIWCDIHDYDGKNEYHQDFINNSDYLFMSSDQMKNYKDYMKKLIDQGKKLVVCTHGKKGSTALTSDGIWIENPIIPTYNELKRDTNGAGDSFFSGFVYAFSKEYSIKKCLQYGSIVAGLSITSYELYYPELTIELVESEYLKYF